MNNKLPPTHNFGPLSCGQGAPVKQGSGLLFLESGLREASEEFHGSLSRVAQRLRERLREEEGVNEMTLEISVSGRVLDGDLLVQCKLDSGWRGACAEGGNLLSVVTEFIRRHAWQRYHSPLCIPYVQRKDKA